MTSTQYTAFKPHPAHRAMSTADAKVFKTASEMLVWPNVRQAITDAGGDEANLAHFSREHCQGRPVMPFAAGSDHETIVSLLRATGEALG